MPSRRHNAAIDSSPRRPSSTMRIFSSAPYCLRVARRMSFATCSAEAFCVPAFCLIFTPLKGYDEPEILPSQLSRFCLIGADAGHLKVQHCLIEVVQVDSGSIERSHDAVGRERVDRARLQGAALDLGRPRIGAGSAEDHGAFARNEVAAPRQPRRNRAAL